MTQTLRLDLSRPPPGRAGRSRTARGVIRQNLCLSLGVIALLVVATTSGLSGIRPAVVAHKGSTLLVIANALRLLGYRGPPAAAPSRDGAQEPS